MIQNLLSFSKTFHVVFLVIIIALAFLINIFIKMFIGGFFLIAIIFGGITLKRKNFGVLLLISSLNFAFFSWFNQLPFKAIVMQGFIFFSSSFLAVFLSQEIKSYMDELNQQKEENCKLTKELIMSFVEAIDAKDQYLQNHSYNVYLYSFKLGTELSFSKERLMNLGLGAIFHDIGKLSVSKEILNNPSKLSETEWDEMKKHVSNGPDILKNVTRLQSILPFIKYHHCFYNGSGYPEAIPNEEIPLESRIIAVADAFDAMTSDRPYRKALLEEQAFEELRLNSGSQFDPIVVDAFFKANIHIIPHNSSKHEMPDFFMCLNKA